MSVDASPSPPPSLTVRSPPSSRTSLDVPAATNSPLSRPANSRRNRAALRDYYGIKSAGDDAGSTADGAPSAAPPAAPPTVLGDLDRDGFDAAAYVKGLLESASLAGVLQVEGALVGEMRGLDGDRKALVYDNYSKLIAATDTIQKMRANMDPLTPATSTLAPAISHIAETAAALGRELGVQGAREERVAGGRGMAGEVRTVRWVLDAPRRFQQLLAEDGRAEAEDEWKTVRALLDRWSGVEGAADVKRQCERVLDHDAERDAP